MRILLEPQGKYRATSHRPSRPSIPRPARKPLFLQVTPDDGYFDHLKDQEPSRSNTEAKSAMTTSTRQIQKKESLLTKLFGGRTNDRETFAPNVDDGLWGKTWSTPKDEDATKPLTRDHLDDHDDKEQKSSTTSPITSIVRVSESMPTSPTVSSETIPSISPTGGVANIMANLKLESSRSEINLLALGVLGLVVTMGIAMWIGVGCKLRSAGLHRKENQARSRPEEKDRDNNEGAANISRMSSTKKLLKSSLLASSSGGSGLDDPGMMPPVLKKTGLALPKLVSALSRSKAKFGRKDDTKKGDDTKNGTKTGQRLFEEVFPQPSVTSTVRHAFELQESSQFPSGEHDKPVSGFWIGFHQHDLVPGPPTVMPVSGPPVPDSSSSASSSRRASISTAASELLGRARSKSNAIITDTILPPVQAQMDLLTEIGRRVSFGVQAGVGSVIRRGSGEDRQRTDDQGEGGYGYSLPQYQEVVGPSVADDGLSLSTGETGSITPPEERYRRDLESGIVLPVPTISTRETDAVNASGSSRAFDQPGGTSSAVGGPPRDVGGGGLVRRSNVRPRGRRQHHVHPRKQVSFVDGFVSDPSVGSGSGSDAGGRRLAGFSFLRRGSGEARRPVDEEMAGHNGLEEDLRKKEQRFLQLV
ncbi:hypothetical protein V8F33_001250 [Rhypophila sp. PSN 637]